MNIINMNYTTEKRDPLATPSNGFVINCINMIIEKFYFNGGLHNQFLLKRLSEFSTWI